MKRLTIVALALAMPGAAPAQTPTAAAVSKPVEPGALNAARELLRSINFDAQMESAAHQSAVASFNTILAAEEAGRGQSTPPGLKAAIQAALTAEVSILVSEIKKTGLEEAAAIYARHFTEAEVRELQRLQENPVMKKAQRLSPTLVTELGQIGIRAASAGKPRLEAALKRAVDEWMASQGSPPRR